MKSREQLALFCRCGRVLPPRALLCPPCSAARYRSRARFAGQREAVLERDAGRCTACGIAPAHPHVHHRRPGEHLRRWLVTLCPACHARIHRLAKLPRRPFPERLIELWAEQHPQNPRQLQLFAEELACV